MRIPVAAANAPGRVLSNSASITLPAIDRSRPAAGWNPISAKAFVNASFQHVGTRFTQPADQENNPRTFTHGLPFGGAPATASTTVDLKLPDYQLVNLSAGVKFDGGLSLTAYVNNLFDENPLLSFDRERGGRARLGFSVGQPRTFGITGRKEF